MTSLKSECRFVPFSELAHGYTVRLFGKVPLTARACETDPEHYCWVSVPGDFMMSDSVHPDPLPREAYCQSFRVPVGSSFWVQYREDECEVRVGRRISVRDA